MDVFSRTFLPAAAEAGVPLPTVSRHMPIFRRCVEPDDTAVLVSRCLRPDSPMAGDFLMLVTYRRFVVTQETRVLHRLRLHLNANLRHLTNVTWSPDPARLDRARPDRARPNRARPSMEIAATAVDGVRERFRLRLSEPEAVRHFDSLLQHVFRPAKVAA